MESESTSLAFCYYWKCPKLFCGSKIWWCRVRQSQLEVGAALEALKAVQLHPGSFCIVSKNGHSALPNEVSANTDNFSNSFQLIYNCQSDSRLSAGECQFVRWNSHWTEVCRVRYLECLQMAQNPFVFMLYNPVVDRWREIISNRSLDRIQISHEKLLASRRRLTFIGLMGGFK